jgi:hypothetical protein
MLLGSCGFLGIAPRRNNCWAEEMIQQAFARSCLISVALAVVGLSAGACARQDARIQQHQEKLESLGSTTAAIGRAWLGGDTSGTFTRIALERTFLLVEQERSALAGSPQALADPRGAHLSQAAERLSRLLAMTINDVVAADAGSVRRRLTEIPLASSARR